MRILWHSAAPWHATGYGQQTAIWTKRLSEAGHTVAISPYAGRMGASEMWEGMQVYPAPFEVEAIPLVMRGNIEDFKPDLIIGLFDAWRMDSWPMDGYKAVMWMPVDTDPISVGDKKFLDTSKVKAIAMSQAGQKAIRAAGHDAPYVPHAIDTAIFRPLEPQQRRDYREGLGLGPATFAVGINASNVDPYRKALPEQILAFKRFHAKHPDSRLFLNSMVHQPGSLHLGMVVMQLGLQGAVTTSDQYRMFSGGIPQDMMVAWYGCMDVVMNATRGEGFGVPAVEAQACGTPVILSRNTTGPELAGPGWLVKCQPFWNMTHLSWQSTPSVDGLVEALGKAHAAMGQPFKRQACRQFAERYDIDRVWPMWEHALAVLA